MLRPIYYLALKNILIKISYDVGAARAGGQAINAGRNPRTVWEEWESEREEAMGRSSGGVGEMMYCYLFVDYFSLFCEIFMLFGFAFG